MRPNEQAGRRPLGRQRIGMIETQRTEHRFPPFDSPVEQIHIAEKFEHELRSRLPIDLFRRPDLFDPPAIHDHDTIRHLERFLLIVRDENACDMQTVVQLSEPAPQALPDLGVQGSEWFVQQQYTGLGGQGAGQGHALALAARQLRRIAMTQPAQRDRAAATR